MDNRPGLTIRECLKVRKRKLMVLVFGAWVGVGVTGFVAAHYRIAWLPLPFFVLFFTSIGLVLYGLNCPRCKGPLGITNPKFSGRTRWLIRRTNFCPYCGVSLDEPMAK